MIEEPFAIDDHVFQYYDENNNQTFTTATLYVPKGTKSKYDNTPGWMEFTNIIEMDLEEVSNDEEIAFGGEESEIDENTNLDGNVVGNVYYNIQPDNGGYNKSEGCIELTKATTDEEMAELEGKDIFGEDVRKNFTGVVFKLSAGKGIVTINAETMGGMTLKVKFGNQEPMELVLEGKMKMKLPYNVDKPTYVYIYAGETNANATRSQTYAAATPTLKLYSLEVEQEPMTKGDVNGDGKVNVGDIMAVINIMAGQGSNNAKGDVNEDGKVNVGDIMAVINIMAGK